MKYPTNELSIKELKENFRYDPITGIIESYNKRSNTYKQVGFLDSRKYLSVTFKGKFIKAHRLAWLLYYGKFPIDEIDHINRIQTDNRIENLREADRYMNNQNRVFTKPFSYSYSRKLEIFNSLLSGEDPKTIQDLKYYFPYSFKAPE
jgi:hypothetical protein